MQLKYADALIQLIHFGILSLESILELQMLHLRILFDLLYFEEQISFVESCLHFKAQYLLVHLGF
jgi:hypothetical protein